MSRTSVLVHPPKTPLVILRQDFLAICEQSVAAAAILAHFEYLTNSKISISSDTWFSKSNRELREDLLGMYSEKTVSAALALLMTNGFIKRRINPVNKTDRTYQYQLQIAVVQQQIDAFALRNSTAPIQEIYEMEDVDLRNHAFSKNTECIYREKEKEKEIKESLSAAQRVGAGAPLPVVTEDQQAAADDLEYVASLSGVDEDGHVVQPPKPLWMTMKPIRTEETTWGQLNGWTRTDFPHWHSAEQIVARWGSDTRQTYKPNDKRIQAAMKLGWGLDPGAYAGKRAKQLLGVGEGEWGKHNISPAMTPVEIVAYGIWYKRSFADQQPVSKPEQVGDYVSRFRDWMQAREPEDQVTIWKIAESRLAAELGEHDPHATIVVDALALETIS